MPIQRQTRLRRLPGEIKQLAAKHDPAARLEAHGNDPVSQIAKAVNLLRSRLAKREASLREVAEYFGQTFWVINPKGKRIMYLNGGKGLSSDPKAWINAAHKDDRKAVQAMLDKQRHGEGGQTEFRVAFPDGGVRWLWCRHIPIAGKGGRLARTVGVFEDVTEQKEAEHILSVSQHELHNIIELRQSQKMQSAGELMGGIAHEINTPIQYVGDNLHFVRDALPKLDELLKATAQQDTENSEWEYLRTEIPKALLQAQEGVDRVAKIAKTLKEFSREQRDQGRKSANLNQAIESTLIIARNAVKYVADVETVYGALPLVNCHLGDIQQVVLDLLIRAAQSIGEVKARTKQRGVIHLETRPAGDWVTISISDTGVPLSPEAQQLIFETAGDSEGVRGLALAHAIVTAQHGGTLACTSDAAKGNSFSIRLPVLGRSASSFLAAGAG